MDSQSTRNVNDARVESPTSSRARRSRRKFSDCSEPGPCFVLFGFTPRQLTKEPRPGYFPVACHSLFRNLEYLSRLCHTESAEKPQFHDFGLSRINSGERCER